MRKICTFALVVFFLLIGIALAQVQPDANQKMKYKNSARLLDAPGSPVFFVDPFNVDPVLSPTQAPATWYPDRYTPAGFAKFAFGGEFSG